MNYKLYQIDLEKDTERYAFLGQEFLDELGLCFPPPHLKKPVPGRPSKKLWPKPAKSSPATTSWKVWSK